MFNPYDGIGVIRYQLAEIHRLTCMSRHLEASPLYVHLLKKSGKDFCTFFFFSEKLNWLQVSVVFRTWPRSLCIPYSR